MAFARVAGRRNTRLPTMAASRPADIPGALRGRNRKTHPSGIRISGFPLCKTPRDVPSELSPLVCSPVSSAYAPNQPERLSCLVGCPDMQSSQQCTAALKEEEQGLGEETELRELPKADRGL
ncbi:hypothetical protein NDU88_005308 [Pleurodeles waltl]|uniref:Uncharacterized protein n=1 Tax=Pleurodeles waltl TaxID=8319 RepID=A0AAV7MWD0_PLEWA|nr:hypothetical protein NDU88_005308 [Pleurodeles waltl]